MLFQRFFSWVFSASDTEQPYQWTLDALGNKSKKISKNVRYVSEEQNRYKEKAERSVKESLKLLSLDGWKLRSSSEIGEVYVMKHNKYGTIFKFVGTVNIPASKLIRILFHDFEKSPTWNVCLSDAKILLSIDENTNIAQTVTYKMPFIANRYFINLRYSTVVNDAYIHSAVSIDYHGAPKNSEYIRGDQKFCTYIIKPFPGNSSVSEFTWLLQTNLRGQLPQWLVDRSISTGIYDHIKSLNKLKPH